MADKKGKKGKKGGGSDRPSNDVLKQMIRSVFPSGSKGLDKSFRLTSEKSEDSSKAINTYSESMFRHTMAHYEMFIRSRNLTTLTIFDLINYHVYGDYRATYSTPPPPATPTLRYFYTAQPAILPHVDLADMDLTPQNILAPLRAQLVNYVYTKNPPNPASYQATNIQWMNQELESESSGKRLMLPSIGTQIISTFQFEIIGEELKKLVTELAGKLDSLMKDREPDFKSIATQSPLDIPNDARIEFVISYLATAMDLSSSSGLLEGATGADVRSAAAEARKKSTVDLAITKFIDTLITSQVSRYDVGDRVTFDTVRPEYEGNPGPIWAPTDGADIDDVTFDVITVTQLPDKKYTYTIQYEANAPIPNVRESDILPVGAPKNKGKKKKKKIFIGPPSSKDLALYRAMIDHLVGLQTYLYFVEEENNLSFQYLSKSLNGGTSKEAAKKLFGAMKSPTGQVDRGTKKYKPGDSLLGRLVIMRQLYTQISLAAQRSSSMVFDKKIFDDFYRGDLLLKEVEWLSHALTEEGKVVVAREERTDPLAALKYTAPGAGEGIQLVGQADLRAAFYRIEAPMIKEVMKEYVEVFNTFSIEAAYNVQKASELSKEAPIAKALWGQLKAKSKSVFQEEGILPHKLFATLFDNVKGQLGMYSDPYPPSWASTNNITKLTVDPVTLGKTTTEEEYLTLLEEYMVYLQARYGEDASVASAVLTTLEIFRIENATDYSLLREGFLKRLEDDNKRKQIKSTNIHFQAYTTVIAILRAELSIPLGLRQDNTAQAVEAQLVARKPGDRGIVAYGEGHPKAPKAPGPTPPNLAEIGEDLVAAIRGTPPPVRP